MQRLTSRCRRREQGLLVKAMRPCPLLIWGVSRLSRNLALGHPCQKTRVVMSEYDAIRCKKLSHLIALVFLFILLPSFLQYIYISRQGLREKINHLSKAGVAVSATIEQRSHVTCGDVTCYYIAYRFKIAEPGKNIIYYAKVDASEHIYYALAGIRYVNVRYLASEPRFSCLELDCSFSNSVVNEPIFEGFNIKQY